MEWLLAPVKIARSLERPAAASDSLVRMRSPAAAAEEPEAEEKARHAGVRGVSGTPCH
jgi:hypothetical protein